MYRAADKACDGTQKNKLPRKMKPVMVLKYCSGVLAIAALLSISTQSSCAAPAAAAPGGKGEIQSSVGGNCFKPDNATVTEVCSNWTIKWKLSSLMGEPVGNYTLKWKMTSIRLNDPSGKPFGNGIYRPEDLPVTLRNAASKIELYIDASALVTGGAAGAIMHHFDTGVAVRAGDGESYNVPGSPNWGKLFQVSRPGIENCKDVASNFIGAEKAKEVFKAGAISLGYLTLCPKSGVSELGAIASAMHHLCDEPNASKRYKFCAPESTANPQADVIADAFASLEKPGRQPAKPRQNAKPKDSIDAAFGQMETDIAEQKRVEIAAVAAKRASDEKAAALKIRHDTAVSFCKTAMNSTKECIQSRCSVQPSMSICIRQKRVIDDTPDDNAAKSDSNSGTKVYRYVFPRYECAETGPNPKYAEWESCSKAAASQCNVGKQYPSFDACVVQREKAAATP